MSSNENNLPSIDSNVGLTKLLEMAESDYGRARIIADQIPTEKLDTALLIEANSFYSNDKVKSLTRKLALRSTAAKTKQQLLGFAQNGSDLAYELLLRDFAAELHNELLIKMHSSNQLNIRDRVEQILMARQKNEFAQEALLISLQFSPNKSTKNLLGGLLYKHFPEALGCDPEAEATEIQSFLAQYFSD